MQDAPQAIAAYFSEKLGAPVNLISVKQSFPGISRETWLLRAEVAGTPQAFVLRIDPPEGSGGPQPMRYEWDIYRKLFGSSVSVAEPLWYNDNISFADGRPHMVRRMVEGSTTVDGLHGPEPHSAALRRRVAYECIEKLAAVHLLDWRKLGFGDIMPIPADPSDAFRADFSAWRARWEKDGPFPSPVFEEVLCWLAPLIPTSSPRISLCKGNNGLGEEIWQDGRIVAMSDWEVAGLGDGVCDLFWSQGTVGLIGFDEVVAHYGDCMGIKVTPDRLAFAAIYAFVKQYICGMACWYRHFHEGRTNRPYALSARTYMQDMEYRLGRCIGLPLEKAASLLSGNEKTMYADLEQSKI